ncbi:MAG: ABC transporter substrate-binding protein [Chloroflexota bacterium]|nr:ABC transporter substrate-binding protein [Chloroflexota bacterium]
MKNKNPLIVINQSSCPHPNPLPKGEGTASSTFGGGLRWGSERLILISLLIAFTLLLTACNSSAESTSPEEVIEITDTTGHTISLDGFPQRIAIVGKATVMVQDAVFLFEEADERIVAMEKRKQSMFDFLAVVEPAIEDREILEKDAGPEQIAAAKPDLVIMKNFLAEKLGHPLETLGIPVLYLDLETPDAFYQDISALGQVFGNPERAQEIIAFYQSRVEAVDEIMTGLSDEQKPRLLLLEYSDQGGEIAFCVPPAGWLQTMMVERAGGRPIWVDVGVGGGWTVVTIEQIAAWNPDQIYIIDYKGQASQVVKDLQTDPLWASLKAVQNDNLYAFGFDFYSWDQPDTRWVLGLQWLATKIHPERTAEIDILAQVESFYATLYRMDTNTIAADILPLLTGDVP